MGETRRELLVLVQCVTPHVVQSVMESFVPKRFLQFVIRELPVSHVVALSYFFIECAKKSV